MWRSSGSYVKVMCRSCERHVKVIWEGHVKVMCRSCEGHMGRSWEGHVKVIREGHV